MDCMYIAPLSKVLYNLCLSFTHLHTHSYTTRDWMPCKVPTSLWGAYWGLGVLLRDTSTQPGWDRTGNPPTARWLLSPPEPYHPTTQGDKNMSSVIPFIYKHTSNSSWTAFIIDLIQSFTLNRGVNNLTRKEKRKETKRRRNILGNLKVIVVCFGRNACVLVKRTSSQ